MELRSRRASRLSYGISAPSDSRALSRGMKKRETEKDPRFRRPRATARAMFPPPPEFPSFPLSIATRVHTRSRGVKLDALSLSLRFASRLNKAAHPRENLDSHPQQSRVASRCVSQSLESTRRSCFFRESHRSSRSRNLTINDKAAPPTCRLRTSSAPLQLWRNIRILVASSSTDIRKLEHSERGRGVNDNP